VDYGQAAAKLLIRWRPRRDLNPCYRRERPRPSRLYKNLEGAGGAVRPLKLRRKNLSLHDCYMKKNARVFVANHAAAGGSGRDRSRPRYRRYSAGRQMNSIFVCTEI
jgi:hypothetical protein